MPLCANTLKRLRNRTSAWEIVACEYSSATYFNPMKNDPIEKSYHILKITSQNLAFENRQVDKSGFFFVHFDPPHLFGLHDIYIYMCIYGGQFTNGKILKSLRSWTF